MTIDFCPSFARLMVLAVLMLIPVCCGGQRYSGESTGVIGDSVLEFSREQGKNGWYFGYWDRAKDADGNYTQSSDFKLLKHFGKDTRNGLNGRSEFTTGDLWYLEDGQSYTSLWAKGGHANSAIQLGHYPAAEQWATRRWISDASRNVTISGHVGKVMPWGANWSGECKAMIIVDGEIVFSTVMDELGLDYSVAVKVEEKSIVDFMIAPNPSIGVVEFTATIRKRPK
jgi:hypothetical protein